MCGIAGILHQENVPGPPSADLLRRMIGMIRHRGPDEYGMYRDHHAGLVHARLSIIDLSSGQQPLTNEDETLWIVFNGEIFNYVELRRDLEADGHRFRTHSDTEVIVHAFEAWGEQCFSRFNGQWALALWDSRRRRLVLSRDRVGVRPLFIHENNGVIRFASEVKAIFADPSVPRTISAQGLAQTFTYWASVAPSSMFTGVEELRPGSVRVYESDGSVHETQFWYPRYPTHDDGQYRYNVQDATLLLRETLEKATRLRITRADVPVGSYLSGGIDSSVTAWLGRQAKAGVFRTYSIRFQDAEYDETPYQRMMASILDSNHEELTVSRADIGRVFPDVIWHAERPILRTAPAPLFLLSRLVRQSGIKAVLTGEGADEVLGGYDIFREAKIREFWSRQKESRCRPMLFDRLYPYLARSPQRARGMAVEFWRQGIEDLGHPDFSHAPRWRTTAMLHRFFSREIQSALAAEPAPDILGSLPQEFSTWDGLGKAQYLEVRTLLSSYLISSQGDRMLMAHSVEGRFPFLDAEVMQFCNELPPRYKIAGLKEKFLLKRIAKGILPPDIVERPKQPYRAPDAMSFIGNDTHEYVSDLLSEEAVGKAGLFDPHAVKTLYAKCVERGSTMKEGENFSNTDNMALVGILSAQLVTHQFVQGHALRDGPPVPFTTIIDKSGEENDIPASPPQNERHV